MPANIFDVKMKTPPERERVRAMAGREETERRRGRRERRRDGRMNAERIVQTRRFDECAESGAWVATQFSARQKKTQNKTKPKKKIIDF